MDKMDLTQQQQQEASEEEALRRVSCPLCSCPAFLPFNMNMISSLKIFLVFKIMRMQLTFYLACCSRSYNPRADLFN